MPSILFSQFHFGGLSVRNRAIVVVVELKEIWLSMTIDVGDLNVKAKQTLKFLAAGNKVKVSIKLRGRQNAHSSMGIDVMNKFFELVKENAVMERKPLLEGRNILMILAPQKA